MYNLKFSKAFRNEEYFKQEGILNSSVPFFLYKLRERKLREELKSHLRCWPAAAFNRNEWKKGCEAFALHWDNLTTEKLNETYFDGVGLW